MQFRNNQDLLDEVSKKLLPLAKEQEISSKFINKNEEESLFLQSLEKKLANKINKQKNLEFAIEEKSLNKIENILNMFSKLQPNTLSLLNSQFSIKQNKEIQTDKDETQILLEKYNTISKDYQNANNLLENLKKENQILFKENEEIKGTQLKLIKENKLLHNTIDEMTKNNIENKKIIQNLQIENKKLNDLILENKNKIADLIKNKKLLEDKITLDMDKKQIKNTKNISNLNGLLYSLNSIVSFLTLSEICNLKLSSKAVSIEIANSSDILRNFYSRLITEKNNKISSLQNYEIKKEYLINNTKLETLIRDYAVFNTKTVGKDLKLSIGRCLTFINRDVKVPLGFQPSKLKNSSNDTSGINTPSNFVSYSQIDNSNAYSTFFGGIKNMFGFSNNTSPNYLNQGQVMNNNYNNYSNYSNFSFKENTNPYSKGSSLNSSFNNLADFKKYLNENEQNICNELEDPDLGIASNYEFDFCTPDDIRQYLHRFLKGNFSADKLTNFIKELALGYSELLFFSKKTLVEIKELVLVKNALNERFKFYQKLANDYEKSNSSLNKKENINSDKVSTSNLLIDEEEYNKTIQEQYEKLKKEVEENKFILISFQTKANLYKSKYEDAILDFHLFKNTLGRENKNLKFLYEKAIREKKELEKKNEDFQKYFEEILKN